MKGDFFNYILFLFYIHELTQNTHQSYINHFFKKEAEAELHQKKKLVSNIKDKDLPHKSLTYWIRCLGETSGFSFSRPMKPR